MRTQLFAFILPLAFSDVGHAKDFSCTLQNDKSVVITGVLEAQRATVRIDDEKGVLGIKEVEYIKEIELERLNRKKEAQYIFAKYYGELNAWQDMDIAIPKKLNSQSFTAYLTLYRDHGDHMVPGESEKLSCETK
jgi:hypothetical protein